MESNEIEMVLARQYHGSLRRVANLAPLVMVLNMPLKSRNLLPLRARLTMA